MRVFLPSPLTANSYPQPPYDQSPSSVRPCTPASRQKRVHRGLQLAHVVHVQHAQHGHRGAHGLVRAGRASQVHSGRKSPERREVPRRLFCLFFLLRALHGVPERARRSAPPRARTRASAPRRPPAAPLAHRRLGVDVQRARELHQFRPERRVGQIRHPRARRAIAGGGGDGATRWRFASGGPEVPTPSFRSSQPRPARPRRRGSRAPPRWTAGGRTRAPSPFGFVASAGHDALARERGERARPVPGVDGPPRPARPWAWHGSSCPPARQRARGMPCHSNPREARPSRTRLEGRRASARSSRSERKHETRSGWNVRRRRFRGDWAFS